MLFSCNQSKEKKESVLDNNKDNVNVIDSSLVDRPDEYSEDFNTFVEKFSREERFQIQRIKFPISVVVPDSEHEAMASMEEKISRYDWEQLDLILPGRF